MSNKKKAPQKPQQQRPQKQRPAGGKPPPSVRGPVTPLRSDSQPPSSRDASTLQAAAEGLADDGAPPLAQGAFASDSGELPVGPEGEELEIDEIVAPADPEEAPRDVAERIRELEERLDRMIDEAARRTGPGAAAEPSPRRRATTHPPPRAAGAESDGTVLETARELLSSDFYLRKWGRLGMRNRSEEVDDFGFDPVYEEKVLPFFNFLYEKYFRVDCEGAARVPGDGRCLLVANHSGTLPYDGMMIRLAVKREHPKQRDVRWLAEDFVFHFPFLGSFMNRIGAVRACQENAERLLQKDALVAVFPEGVKGIGKLFKQRYRLQRFGRGGFVKLCLRTSTPIVPVAVVGAEESNPMLYRLEYLTRAIGLPYFPVTPTFPLLGPLGLLPAPTKWKIEFGEPIALDGYGPEAADDEILVGRLAERVRATIQAMLDRLLGERRSVWFG